MSVAIASSCPMSTPWGKVDGYPERLGDGIYFVSTASHGGIWLSQERIKEIRQRIGNLCLHPTATNA